MVTIRHSNPKWMEKLLAVYAKGGAVLAIGWPAGKASSIAYPDGTQVALVAAVNNFGSSSRGIPARPFLAEGAVDAVEATRPIAETLVPKMNQGKVAVEQILEHMGPFAVAAVQEKITDGQWEPNAPETVKRKKSSKPLTDTGLLRSSVTYLVRKD